MNGGKYRVELCFEIAFLKLSFHKREVEGSVVLSGLFLIEDRFGSIIQGRVFVNISKWRVELFFWRENICTWK